MRRLGVALTAAGAVLAVSAACQPATVRLTFRPPVGARYRYQIEVRELSVTRFPGTPPERTPVETVLRADHTVLESGPGGVRVQVELRAPRAPTRSFVVRFDRAAQLAGVDSVEGLPASAVGSLALPEEIFPSAVTAAPNRPLAPGERWTIDAPLRLTGAAPARLQGTGRLVELGVRRGRKLASVRARTTLPVARATQLPGGTVVLEGSQATDSEVTHAVADGAVEEATTTTRGSFRLTLVPPTGGPGPPVVGRLSIQVKTVTRRVG